MTEPLNDNIKHNQGNFTGGTMDLDEWRIKNKMTSEWNANGIRWKAQAKYVDIDTGEILTRKDGEDKTKYIIIKTTKNETEYNHNKTAATIHYTKQCRKQPQQQFKFD